MWTFASVWTLFTCSSTQVLSCFSKLFSLLAHEPFTVDNPFLWITKTHVINLIGDAGCNDLIQHSVSCMHTQEDYAKLYRKPN